MEYSDYMSQPGADDFIIVTQAFKDTLKGILNAGNIQSVAMKLITPLGFTRGEKGGVVGRMAVTFYKDSIKM